MSARHTAQFLRQFAWGLALVVVVVFIMRQVGALS